MTKINQLRSKVMKAAWYLKKVKGMTMTQAMKKAWHIQKAVNNKGVAKFDDGKQVEYQEYITDFAGRTLGKVYANVWEKYGKSRLYLKAYFEDGSSRDLGFFDVTNGLDYTEKINVSLI
jgi:hypothetical protein